MTRQLLVYRQKKAIHIFFLSVGEKFSLKTFGLYLYLYIYLNQQTKQLKTIIMKIITETDLTTFKFWSGAKDFSELLTYTELKEITEQLEDLYPDGLTDTQINDLFWFDRDFICELIGLDTETIFNG